MLEIDHPSLGNLNIALRTDGQHDAPSDEQLAAIRRLQSVGDSINTKIANATRHFADNWVGLDQFDYLRDEDFGIRFSGGIVLPVDSNGRTYLILHGESEVDIEHGLACVFGPDGRFGVTHADVAFSPPDPDGYDELAAVVDSAQT